MANDKVQGQIKGNSKGSSRKDVSFPGGRTEKKKSKTWLWILIIILVLAGLGVGAWYLLSEPPVSEEEFSPTPTSFEQNTSTPTQAEIDRSAVSIDVLNGTGLPGAAGDLQDELENLGYTDIEIGNASRRDYEATEVTFDPSVPQGVKDEIMNLLNDEYEGVEESEEELGVYNVEIITGYPSGHTATPTEGSQTSTPTPTTESSGTITGTTTPTSSPTPTP
jgi:hypothetical protein